MTLRFVLKKLLRLKSTCVRVPRLGSNWGDARILVQSVVEEGTGLLVLYETVFAQTGAATARQRTARTKTHKHVVGILLIIAISPRKGKTPVLTLPTKRPKIKLSKDRHPTHAACGMGSCARSRRHPATPEGLRP